MVVDMGIAWALDRGASKVLSRPVGHFLVAVQGDTAFDLSLSCVLN